MEHNSGMVCARQRRAGLIETTPRPSPYPAIDAPRARAPDVLGARGKGVSPTMDLGVDADGADEHIMHERYRSPGWTGGTPGLWKLVQDFQCSSMWRRKAGPTRPVTTSPRTPARRPWYTLS